MFLRRCNRRTCLRALGPRRQESYLTKLLATQEFSHIYMLTAFLYVHHVRSPPLIKSHPPKVLEKWRQVVTTNRCFSSARTHPVGTSFPSLWEGLLPEPLFLPPNKVRTDNDWFIGKAQFCRACHPTPNWHSVSIDDMDPKSTATVQSTPQSLVIAFFFMGKELSPTPHGLE